MKQEATVGVVAYPKPQFSKRRFSIGNPLESEIRNISVESSVLPALDQSVFYSDDWVLDAVSVHLIGELMKEENLIRVIKISNFTVL